MVDILINDCENTEYKHLISKDVYTCQPCTNGLYTLDSTECKPSDNKLACKNHKIIVKQKIIMYSKRLRTML